ncbi:nucleotidyl transferase AbiEii/AbiGii toxin family protein [Nocardia cyriacigeorgica]|uniref:nucleotidyl transferase AbiEii/AbiGii toxin family protein n=1 Tax=Nocardia cyriacigeorgica TaxID=135487 RepID=UPI0024579C9C|nr:nucleotidyl transferase AbiEii/AbiGii toxin family protein [Nocardia cyriacigeorgica]
MRFLARVFVDPDSPWVLKGGGGLLVRINEGARYSQDADLMRTDVTAEEAIAELQGLLARVTDLDPLTFQVKRSKSNIGGLDSARLTAEVYYGPKRLHSFPIDLSIRSTLAAGTDHVVPTSIIDLDGFSDLPAFKVLSLADQVGDKVAAMYQGYGPTGATPSTRYHDLVDLHLIIARFPIDAAATTAALRLQQQRRANLALPLSVASPGPQWAVGYRTEARNAKLDPRLHALDEALAALAVFLDPLLDGTRSAGTWNPLAQGWSES